MSDETRTTSPLSDRDLSLLSTYIDGELSAAQGASLQRRLQQEPALQAELDALQRTVSLLQSLPAVSPPRNFTLNVAEYGHIVPVRRSRWLTFGTPLVAAGASLLLVAVCVGVLLLRGGLRWGEAAWPGRWPLMIALPKVTLQLGLLDLQHLSRKRRWLNRKSEKIN